MELCYVQCPTVTSIPRNGLLTDKYSLFNLPVNSKKKCRDFRRIRVLQFRARPSGATKIKCQAQAAAPSSVDTEDGNVVFVAGATGRVGSRTVRELIKLGVKVRAGVRSIKRADTLVQSVKNIKAENVAGGAQPIDKLELVECDLEKPDQIAPALGNSSVVICCIGASEKEIFDVTGPYRIDYQATKNLVDAATSVKVDHFILVTSLGTNKVGFPAAILNLFWGVLCWKRKAEEALLESGLPYTIVRPGGMERPTDAYKETHNLTLSVEDTLFGGQVSTLQVAELMAFMAKNRSLSYCKVVEVIAETTAPLTPMGDLLKKIPSQRKEPIPKKVDIATGSQPVPESTFAEKEPEQKKPESTSAEKEPEQKKPTVPTPSSPYIAYEDLKPPTSPTPTPSTTPSATSVSKEEIAPAATSPISSSVEVISLEIPSIATEVKKPTPSSPYINYEDLKPPTSPTPTPSSTPGATKASEIEIIPAATIPVSSTTETTSSETSSIVTEVKKPTPSSPYINYEDLKPPTSPTPAASTTPGATKVSETEIIPAATSPVSSTTEVISLETSSIVTEVKKPTPSSPYINYEDLKPPSSPTPTPSGLKKDSSVVQPPADVASPLTGGNGDAKSGIVSDSVEVPIESLASPSLAYDDLKPPSSPSPIVPTLDIKTAENEGSSSAETESKGQPLSPYTMYEDLKPPTSPVPSVPR